MGKLAEDLANMDATGQAELVRNGDASPSELLEAAIERIEEVNPQLNAVVHKMYDEARATVAGDLPDGPFRGVPFLIKDLIAAYGGQPITSGSIYLKDTIAPHDSELVARHKRAGLVILGKTNTPEFGILPTAEPKLFGPTLNPWNTKHSSGGSSGGSSAAVASRMVAMAHGNDGGGSIRVPASCSGLFGLKPTRARNPLGPDIGDIMNGLVCEHAITRSVRDSALLLDCTSGPDIGDPYNAPAKARPFAEEVGADPGKLRIAVMVDAPTGVPVHQDCVDATRETAKLCEELGHHVVEDKPVIDAQMMVQSFMAIWAAGQGMMLKAIEHLYGKKPGTEGFEPLTLALGEQANAVSAADYLMAVAGMQSIGRDVARFFENYDVLLCPTLAEPPALIGTFDSTPDDPMAGINRAGLYVAFTPVFNATGQPAMSVPLVWKNGLPIGTHFASKFGDEATLFRLAAQLEEARPWADKKPPVCAS